MSSSADSSPNPGQYRCASMPSRAARRDWPGFGELSADELTLRHLLPLAHEGLRLWGVSDAVRERYLGVIEGRCTTGVNGAEWSTRAVAAYEAQGHDRRESLRLMLAEYARHMDGNEPVHTWPLP